MPDDVRISPANLRPVKGLTARQLKLLGAFMILLGLVLPLYSCRGRFVDDRGDEVKYVDSHGAVVPDQGLLAAPPPGTIRLEYGMRPPEGIRYRKNYHYFFSNFDRTDVVDWFRLGGMLWPMAAALFADRSRRRWSRWLFRGLEPVLLLETTFSLCIGAMFGAREIGFWVAWLGIAGYGAGAAWSDTAALFAWKPELGRPWKLLGAVLVCCAFLVSSVFSMVGFFL